MVIYLLLDESLGEIGTQNWIGRIEINDTKLNDAIPLGELRTLHRTGAVGTGVEKR